MRRAGELGAVGPGRREFVENATELLGELRQQDADLVRAERSDEGTEGLGVEDAGLGPLGRGDHCRPGGRRRGGGGLDASRDRGEQVGTLEWLSDMAVEAGGAVGF